MAKTGQRRSGWWISAFVGLALGLVCAGPAAAQAQRPYGAGALPGPTKAAPAAERPSGPPVDPNAPPVVGIEIVGNQRNPRERILSKIKTYVGRPFHRATLDEDVQRLYASNWFYDVVAETRETDEGIVVVFRVIERATIQEVQFVGNAHLKEKELIEITGLKPGKPMDPGTNQAMARRIEARYREKGYPFAAVEVAEGSKRGDLNVVMKITEGPRTKIHAVDFEGNSFVSKARLRTLLASKARFLGFGTILPGVGGKYDPENIEQDVAKLIEYYRGFGYLDVRVGRKFEWTEGKEGVKVTFLIDEGPRYLVRDVRFTGNKVIDEGAVDDGLKLTKGQFFSQAALTKDVQTVRDAYGRQGYIHTLVNADLKYLDDPGEVDVVYQVQEDVPRRVGEVKIVGNEVTKARVVRSMMELAPGELADTTKLRKSQQRLLESRLFKYDPAQGIVPMVQFDPANDPAAEFQDILVNVQEDQTGSLLFGVGVNSDSGVGGSFVVHERNFDIGRFPTSMSDLFSGHAWRGAGQEFRLELVPGTYVNRYSVTFREPRLFGLDYSFATSGYFYTRIFSPYSEERGGGRFTLGKRLTPEIGAALTYRVENIDISGRTSAPPPDLVDVIGANFLHSFRLSLDHDTRDSHMNPGQGHYVEIGFEQALGDFDFPRVTLEGKQYWTLHSRADGSGKHVLTARGEVGYSGSHTPMFERFYAGGFRTLRGFDFRGVSPIDGGIEIGGDFMLLSGLEYQFPLTADDNLGWVFFVDAGTVESQVEILDYRVAAGFGLRIQIPAMGPVPLAFDFGFPINKRDGDDTQIFSFFLGIFR